MSTETLTNVQECTFEVDEIDAQARQLILQAHGSIEAMTDHTRQPPFQANRFRVIVPIGTTISGADTPMTIQFIDFPNGKHIRLIPNDFTVELRY